MDIGYENQANTPYFTGKVDSSVRKYVRTMKKKSKKIYQTNCVQNGIKMNPAAFRIIDERCDNALKKITQKADLLHKDTVIRAMKNPNKPDSNLYLVAENKHLLQEWEQKGAIDTLSVYKNSLTDVKGKGQYDEYITRFEGFADKLNPKTLDRKMVRTSISNLWNLNVAKILNGKFGEIYTKSTQKVASEIGYENKTFGDSLKEHFRTVRENLAPKKEQSNTSFFDFLKEIFSKKKNTPTPNERKVI